MSVVLIFPPLSPERETEVQQFFNEIKNREKSDAIRIILNRIDKDEFLARFPFLKQDSIDVHWYHPWHNFLDYRDFHRQIKRKYFHHDFIVLAATKEKKRILKLLNKD